jgi:hypothetical protein
MHLIIGPMTVTRKHCQNVTSGFNGVCSTQALQQLCGQTGCGSHNDAEFILKLR